ncbi:MAG TPA: WD40 repeat domain-containing protein [Thermoguttaceae bacterium]|nr:WD40 repeat domain-containing protein [Thermoguttaceae bacterium]
MAGGGLRRTLGGLAAPNHPDSQGHGDEVTAVAFSLDGSTVATAGWDKDLLLWDVATAKKSQAAAFVRSEEIWSVAFSPDGRLLAMGGGDHSVLLWDFGAWRSWRTLRGHTDRVRAVAFSRDGALLASASDDGRVMLWDARTGRLRGTLAGHTRPVRSVAFSSDGSMLASAGWDNTVRLWDLPPLEPPARTRLSVVTTPTDSAPVAEQDLCDGVLDLVDPGAPEKRIAASFRYVGE